VRQQVGPPAQRALDSPRPASATDVTGLSADTTGAPIPGSTAASRPAPGGPGSARRGPMLSLSWFLAASGHAESERRGEEGARSIAAVFPGCPMSCICPTMSVP
jgi:hypothetical protein